MTFASNEPSLEPRAGPSTSSS